MSTYLGTMRHHKWLVGTNTQKNNVLYFCFNYKSCPLWKLPFMSWAVVSLFKFLAIFWLNSTICHKVYLLIRLKFPVKWDSLFTFSIWPYQFWNEPWDLMRIMVCFVIFLHFIFLFLGQCRAKAWVKSLS